MQTPPPSTAPSLVTQRHSSSDRHDQSEAAALFPGGGTLAPHHSPTIDTSVAVLEKETATSHQGTERSGKNALVDSTSNRDIQMNTDEAIFGDADDGDDVKEIDGVLTLTIHNDFYEANPARPVGLSPDAKGALISLSSSTDISPTSPLSASSAQSNSSGNSGASNKPDYGSQSPDAIFDVCSTAPDSGYSMVQATHGVSEGAWYFEIVIGAERDQPRQSVAEMAELEGHKQRKRKSEEQQHEISNITSEPLSSLALGVSGVPAPPSVRHFEPHWRIGWSRKQASLKAPVGFDKYSYAFRDSTGQVMHESRGKPYGEPFKEGDIIGCYIYIPPTEKTLEERVEKMVDAYENESGQPCQIISYKLRESIAKGSRIRFYKNGKSFGDAFVDIWRGQYFPSASLYMGAQCRFVFGPEGLCYRPEDTNAKPIGILADPSLHPPDPAYIRAPQKKFNNISSGSNNARAPRRSIRQKGTAGDETSVSKHGPRPTADIDDSRFKRKRPASDAFSAAKENKPSGTGVVTQIDSPSTSNRYGEAWLKHQRMANAARPDVSIASEIHIAAKPMTDFDNLHNRKKILAVTTPLSSSKSSRRRTPSQVEQIKKSMVSPIARSKKQQKVQKGSLDNGEPTRHSQPLSEETQGTHISPNTQQSQASQESRDPALESHKAPLSFAASSQPQFAQFVPQQQSSKTAHSLGVRPDTLSLHNVASSRQQLPSMSEFMQSIPRVPYPIVSQPTFVDPRTGARAGVSIPYIVSVNSIPQPFAHPYPHSGAQIPQSPQKSREQHPPSNPQGPNT